MNAKRRRRRGVMLAVVVIVMTLVGGLLVMLAAAAAERYRHHQADRVRLVARAITDSAADYARSQLETWSQTPPDEPIELDISDLLGPRMTGSATVAVLTIDGQKRCRVSTHVNRGMYASVNEMSLDME